MSEPKRTMDSFGTGDMQIPEIKLVQNVGADYAREALKAKPGDFFCPLSDEVIPGAEGFNMIVVDMLKNRTYWGRDEIGEDPPQCASMDANSMVSIAGDDCNTCLHRCDTPWLVSATDRRDKCTINYNILAIKIDDQLPILIRASGISTTPVRELITLLRLNRSLKGEYHRAQVHVTSAKKKTAAGEAFQFHFGKPSLIEDKVLVKELALQSAQMLGTQIALPVGRPEPEPSEEKEPSGEREPVAYELDGTPIYDQALGKNIEKAKELAGAKDIAKAIGEKIAKEFAEPVKPIDVEF